MKNSIIKIAMLFLALMTAWSCKEKTKQQEPKVEVGPPVDYLHESKEAFNARMEWWRDAQFGMFIHWGLYSVPAGIYRGKEIPDKNGEWIMNNAHIPITEYEKYVKEFDPVKFNADSWAKTIKDAGMKYVVITSKHHDGFALWDSKVSNYDVVDASPYGKDILRALSEACKKQGIKFGLYYSIMDWHHPDAQAVNYPDYNKNKTPEGNPNFKRYLETYMKPQLKELIENYDPAILWFDGEWIVEYTHDEGKELYQYVRSLKPDIIINNRVDKGRQGMQGMNKEDSEYAGDFGTPEQEILENTSALDWESCMTMNDTWGFKKNDHNWKSADELIYNLIDVVAKGGNYLLNVGPTAEGLMPEPSLERLHKIGQWLGVNGEAIYNTEKLAHSYKEGEDIRLTKKKGKPIYYGIVLKNPGHKISFKSLKPSKGSAIFLLGYQEPLPWTFSEKMGVTINVPKKALDAVGKTRAWVFNITGEEL